MPNVISQTSTDLRPGVLVVDDVAVVRAVLRVGLQFHGFDVHLAGDGREAIDLYRRERDHIGVVLLDVQMPGLDGPNVLIALRGIDPGVRAYFMTGDPGVYGEDGLLALGACRVFAKPFDIAAVAAELRQGITDVARRGPAGTHPPARA